MITLENVSKVYNPKKRNNFTALHDVSLEISEGELTAIVGRSGSGKSTLLHIIGMLDNLTSGKYLFDSTDISGFSEARRTKLRAKYMGFVKQDFALIDDYTALDNVMLPLYPIKVKTAGKQLLTQLRN